MLKNGIQDGIAATKVGNSVPKMIFADLDQGLAVGRENVARNLVARATNAVTSPPAAQNLVSGAMGLAYGQNPLVAIGSNIAGNYGDRVVGEALRSRFGEDSMRAAVAGGLTNLGISFVGGNMINGLFQGDPEAEARQQLQAVQPSYIPLPGPRPPAPGMSYQEIPGAPGEYWEKPVQSASGSGRQFADLTASQGAYQRPRNPEAAPVFADAAAGSMVGLPPLDAATADKLRKRAIENAQQGYFLSTELSSYMDGLK